MKKESKIYIAGHTGLVGSAVTRRLDGEGYGNGKGRTHQEDPHQLGPCALTGLLNRLCRDEDTEVTPGDLLAPLLCPQ